MADQEKAAFPIQVVVTWEIGSNERLAILMKLASIISLILSFYITTPCYAQTEVNIIKSNELCVFSEHFINYSEYLHTTENCVQKSRYSFLQENLINCRTDHFISINPINKDGINKKTFKRFKFSVFDYTDNKIAELNYHALLSSAHPDMGLSYSWDFVILIDSKLYWLNAGCLYSSDNWQTLKNSFIASVDKSINNNSFLTYFNCRCGSGCQSK